MSIKIEDIRNYLLEQIKQTEKEYDEAEFADDLRSCAIIAHRKYTLCEILFFIDSGGRIT